ncbi:hypothetical protein WMY93_008550 [Mugilogobius chulae]|uniref:Delta-sarcoglycan n=1 Tax=Mugilogobius chulae TaxID=88201 RepID=A0AAW0PS15_9GOBI
MMTQEQCSHRNNVQSCDKPQIYKVGIYGWRKRCLYFFVLLLMILILINLALTIWILKVMNFTIDGMGNLRITEKGLKLEGDSEFLEPLYAKEIQSKPGRPLYLQSSRNVSVNIYNSNNQLLTQLVTGSSGLKARGKAFEVKSTSGKLLFSADEDEVVVGADKLRVMGAEGAVFTKSVETPHVRAEPFKELKARAALDHHEPRFCLWRCAKSDKDESQRRCACSFVDALRLHSVYRITNTFSSLSASVWQEGYAVRTGRRLGPVPDRSPPFGDLGYTRHKTPNVQSVVKETSRQSCRSETSRGFTVGPGQVSSLMPDELC